MDQPKKFGLIGAAGYIAPRHMQAIVDTGNELTVATDPNDSVGIIDRHAPECHFFTDFERFDEFLSSHDKEVRFLSICSPNYLHEAHIKYGLRRDMTVICEKPLVLDLAAVQRLKEVESRTNGKIFSILQLRHHDAIIELKKKIDKNPGATYDVDLTYITSRGRWYLESWKGNDQKSGGVVMNIGIHFFDMLGFLFGELVMHEVFVRDDQSASGFMEFERARVKWFLSVDATYLPKAVVEKGQRTFRSISVNGEELEFSEGFTELHTTSYRNILDGRGFGLDVVMPSIKLVDEIRRLDLRTDRDVSRKHGMIR